MKINKIIAALLFASLATVFATSCTNKPNDELPPAHKPDTTTVHDTLIGDVFGITKVEVCKDGTSHELEMIPSGDWTWTTKDKFLTIETPAGTIKDNKLKFRVQENLNPKVRVLATTIKMGGVTKTLNITQKGTAPFIEVYDEKELILAPDVKEMYLTNIVANFVLEVSEKPTWVESIEITKVSGIEYLYDAFVKLKDADFDDADREGKLVFTEKGVAGSTVSRSIDIKCKAFTTPYIVFAPDFVTTFAGKKADGSAITGNFTTYTKPNAEAVGYVIYQRVVKSAGDVVFAAQTWATMATSVSANAAYASKMETVNLANFTTFDDAVNKDRGAAIFAMPLSQVAAFTPALALEATPVATLKQNCYSVIEKVTDLQDPKTLVKNVLDTMEITVKCRTEYGCNAKIFYQGDYLTETPVAKVELKERVKLDDQWDSVTVVFYYKGTMSSPQLFNLNFIADDGAAPTPKTVMVKYGFKTFASL